MPYFELLRLGCTWHPGCLFLSCNKVDRKIEKSGIILYLYWRSKDSRFFPYFVSISTTTISLILRPTFTVPSADLIKGGFIFCLFWSVHLTADIIKYFQWHPPSAPTFWWLQTSFPARQHTNSSLFLVYLCYTQLNLLWQAGHICGIQLALPSLKK